MKKKRDDAITISKKARYDFFIEQSYDAGLVLEGWEVKSLKAGHVQLNESYALIKSGEIFLIGALITPLGSASSHKLHDPRRTRKLLLNRKEINMLIGAVERKGYTLVPVKLFWKKKRVKLQLGLAKGKKQQDKRQYLKEKDWQRDKARLLKQLRQT